MPLGGNIRINSRRRTSSLQQPAEVVDSNTSSSKKKRTTSSTSVAATETPLERAASSAVVGIQLNSNETEAHFLGRLFQTMQSEVKRAAAAAPVETATAASTQHDVYVSSILQKIEALERCVSPRTRALMQDFQDPESSASPGTLFSMADKSGVPLRRIAALRALFAGKHASEGIPEDVFLEKYGAGIIGATTDEERKFWTRSLDRNCDGGISFPEIAGYLTLATDVKQDSDPQGFFETGTVEQLLAKGGHYHQKPASSSSSSSSVAPTAGASSSSTSSNNNINSCYDANTRRLLEHIHNEDGPSLRDIASADGAASGPAAVSTEAPHHCAQITQFIFVEELNRIFTAAEDGLVLAWDPVTFVADPKPMHRGPRPIVQMPQSPHRNLFLVIQDDGCLFLYEVHVDRSRQDPPRVRLLRCYAPVGLSSLETDAEGRMAYPGIVKSRIQRTRLLPAVPIGNFPRSTFVTCADFLPPDRASNDIHIVAGTQQGAVCFVRLTLSSSLNKTECTHTMDDVHTKQVTRVLLLKGRHLMCTCSIDGSLAVVDFGRKAVMHRLIPTQPTPRPLLGLAVDHINFYAFVWCARAVSVWDCITGVRVSMLTEHPSRVVDIQIDAEDRYAFCLLADKSVTVWNTRAWKIVGRVEDTIFRHMYNHLTTSFWWKERGLLLSGCSIPFAWRKRIETDGSGGGDGGDSHHHHHHNNNNSHNKTNNSSDDDTNNSDSSESSYDESDENENHTHHHHHHHRHHRHFTLPHLLCSKTGGHLIGVGQETVHIWNAANGRELNRWFPASEDVVTACALDPDGLRLVVGTESCRVRFLNYCKGYDSVELCHKEQRVDGVSALECATGGDDSLRIVVAGMTRKIVLWIRDGEKFHRIREPLHVMKLPPEIPGVVNCISLVHARRRLFAAGTSASGGGVGRILLLSENLTLLNNFSAGGAVQSLLPCDLSKGLFTALAEGGRASVWGIRRISSDAYPILTPFQSTPLSNDEENNPTAVGTATPASSCIALNHRTIAVGSSEGTISVISIMSSSAADDDDFDNSTMMNFSSSNNNFACGDDNDNGGENDDDDDDAALDRRLALQRAASVAMRAAVTKELCCCFTAHRQGCAVACMTLTHREKEVFTLGEDRVLRQWKFRDDDNNDNHDEQEENGGNDNPTKNTQSKKRGGEGLRAPWILLSEFSFPSSTPVVIISSKNRKTASHHRHYYQHHHHITVTEVTKTHPLYHDYADGHNHNNIDGELPPVHVPLERTVSMASFSKFEKRSDDDDERQQPLKNLTSMAAVVSVAAPLARLKTRKKGAGLTFLEENVQKEPTTEHENTNTTISVSSSSLTPPPPQKVVSGAARRFLAAVSASTPTPSSVAMKNKISSPLQKPSVLSRKECFDRFTSHLMSKSRPGLIRETIHDEGIQVAVRGIRELQEARSNQHVSKVEPPRAFSRMNVMPVDFLQDQKRMLPPPSASLY